ncbi:MAG: hypothetical protein ACRECY_16615, partial [Phyllobacterium sp.]
MFSKTFKAFSLSALVFLAACDGGSDSQAIKGETPPDTGGTFSDLTPANTAVEPGSTKGADTKETGPAVVPPVTIVQTSSDAGAKQTGLPGGAADGTWKQTGPQAGVEDATKKLAEQKAADDAARKLAEEQQLAADEAAKKRAAQQAVLDAAKKIAEREALYRDETAAFDKLAPKNVTLDDPNRYDVRLPDKALALADVDEAPSVMRHTITLQGKTVPYTASAGHLIALAPPDPANPTKKREQAAIFYMAYTRNGLAPEKRPVTFFFNGGPGSASIWLHMGSYAPKVILASDPLISGTSMPSQLPRVDNPITLLDKTDLVFVDPVGTGLSQAIAPYKNKDFWDIDKDPLVLRDFIMRYVNSNNRQSSPKYLYG